MDFAGFSDAKMRVVAEAWRLAHDRVRDAMGTDSPLYRRASGGMLASQDELRRREDQRPAVEHPDGWHLRDDRRLYWYDMQKRRADDGQSGVRMFNIPVSRTMSDRTRPLPFWSDATLSKEQLGKLFWDNDEDRRWATMFVDQQCKRTLDEFWSACRRSVSAHETVDERQWRLLTAGMAYEQLLRLEELHAVSGDRDASVRYAMKRVQVLTAMRVSERREWTNEDLASVRREIRGRHGAAMPRLEEQAAGGDVEAMCAVLCLASPESLAQPPMDGIVENLFVHAQVGDEQAQNALFEYGFAFQRPEIALRAAAVAAEHGDMVPLRHMVDTEMACRDIGGLFRALEIAVNREPDGDWSRSIDKAKAMALATLVASDAVDVAEITEVCEQAPEGLRPNAEQLFFAQNMHEVAWLWRNDDQSVGLQAFDVCIEQMSESMLAGSDELSRPFWFMWSRLLDLGQGEVSTALCYALADRMCNRLLDNELFFDLVTRSPESALMLSQIAQRGHGATGVDGAQLLERMRIDLVYVNELHPEMADVARELAYMQIYGAGGPRDPRSALEVCNATLSLVEDGRVEDQDARCALQQAAADAARELGDLAAFETHVEAVLECSRHEGDTSRGKLSDFQRSWIEMLHHFDPEFAGMHSESVDFMPPLDTPDPPPKKIRTVSFPDTADRFLELLDQVPDRPRGIDGPELGGNGMPGGGPFG